MDTEAMARVIEYLTKTGELLATEGYKLAYRQAIVEGWLWMLACVLGLAVIIGAIIVIKKVEDMVGSGLMILGLGLMLMLMGLIAGLPMLVNPGWRAVQMLIGLAK